METRYKNIGRFGSNVKCLLLEYVTSLIVLQRSLCACVCVYLRVQQLGFNLALCLTQNNTTKL